MTAIVILGFIVIMLGALAIQLVVVLFTSQTTGAAARSALRYLGWLGAAGGFVAATAFVVPRRFEADITVASMTTPPGAAASGRAASQSAGTALQRGELLPAGLAVSSVRPDWIDVPPALDKTTYRAAVKSGLYVTEVECRQALDRALSETTARYIDTYLGDASAEQVIALDPGWLADHLVRQPLYVETVAATVGPMQQLHALLEFDDGVRAELHRLWRRANVSYRLRYGAAGFGLLLAVLGTVSAYLRLDLATGGARRTRLRWTAATAILLLAAGAVGICVS